MLPGALVITASVAAWHLRAYDEDAFIYMRVAENLAHGHGMVFNPGERLGTETTTDFLWTLLNALGILVGLDALRSLELWSLAFFAANLLAVHHLARLLWPRSAVIPVLALVLLGTHYAYVTLSFAGFGTALQSLAALLCLVALHGHCRRPGTGVALGCALAVLVLARLDSAVFVVPVALGAIYVSLGIHQRGNWMPPRALVVAGAIPAVTLAALLAFKVAYYGHVLPATYHTKATMNYGGQVEIWFYVERGLAFLGDWYLTYGMAILVPVAAFAYWRRYRGGRRNKGRGKPGARGVVLVTATAMVACYQLYMLKTGGDYIGFRILMPQVPILLLLVAGGLGALRRWQGAAGMLVALACTGVESHRNTDIADHRLTRAGLALEALPEKRRFIEDFLFVGRGLHTLFGDLGEYNPALKFATPGIGAIGYHSRLLAVEQHGLTDHAIAAAAPADMCFHPTAMIGHRQKARPHLLHRLGVNLVLQSNMVRGDSIDFTKPPAEFAHVDGPRLRWAHRASTACRVERFPADAQLFALPLAGGWAVPVLYLTRSAVIDDYLDAKGVERVDIY